MIAKLRQSSPLRLSLNLFWVLLAVGLLWVTLRSISLAEVWAQLRQLQVGQILLLVAVNLVVLSTFSARWWLLLYAQGYTIPYGKLITYRLATFAVSYFTPGPHLGGEPVQVYLISTRHGVPVAISLTAMLLDRLIEMLANFAFLMAGLLVLLQQQALTGWLEQQLFALCLGLMLLPIGLLLALGLGWRPLSGLLRASHTAWRLLTGGQADTGQWITRSSLYQTARASEEQGSLLCRNHPFILVLALGVSVLSWLGIVGEFWLMTSVLGLKLTLYQAITALVAARVAILLPVPAALGVLEASQALAMSRLGLPPAAGISLSILIRARDVLFGLLGLWIGGVYWWKREQ